VFLVNVEHRCESLRARIKGAWLKGALLSAFVAAFTVTFAPTALAATAKSSSASAKKGITKATPQRVRTVVKLRNGRRVVVHRVIVPAKPSFAALAGLRNQDDALDLKSSAAFVLDQDTNEVLFSKNAGAVLPIASITKLMTALVVMEAGQPLDEMLEVSSEDMDTEKRSRSRLSLAGSLPRRELLHLALMASENRAAHTLGRHYPGGMGPFVAAMNQRAASLGMRQSHFVEPTGLSSQNQSSAKDLAVLVKATYSHQVIRELSTSHGLDLNVGERQVHYRNTNGLVSNPAWDIGLQKTGYISEAGRCLVMQAKMAGRKLVLVFLDSAGKYSRLGDAERVRRWLAEMPAAVPARPAADAAAAARPVALVPGL
jgi:serine-type D-Ala-D-Ala endopeptidase (penicillin-binding protein 7)